MFKELNKVISRIKKLNTGRNLSPQESICRETLLKYTTYRLPKSAEDDRLIAWRMVFRLIARLRSTEKSFEELSGKGSLILAPGIVQMKNIVDHIELQTGENVGFYISKDRLKLKLSFLEKIFIIPRIKLFALYIFFKTISDRNRQRLGLQVIQVFEIAALLQFIKSHQITTVYDFAGFHIDSNFIALLLEEMGVKSTKSPSPGPLEIHYKHLLCHTICVSNPYQEEELSIFSESMIFQERKKWKPQMSHLYSKQYENIDHQNSQKTLGFYSHGEWIRRILGHSDIGRGTLETEDFILDCLSDFMKRNPEYSLKVYPHPLEKRDENIERTKKYYQGKLGDVNFQLATKETRTVDDFTSVNVALVAASTLIYERLFCGFKILIGMLENNSLFHDHSSLNKICFSSQEEFDRLILKSIEMNVEEFFSEYNLSDYHVNSY